MSDDDQSNQAESLERHSVASLDSILGQRFDVLDQGFVRVIDYMGSDAAIVQAARVSYGAGTKHVSEDRALIRYLMRHAHTTPFEMCEIKLHVRVPMDCWRQWIRHRSASVNEYSTRYSVAIDAAQLTPSEKWRSQSLQNRQGSGDLLDPSVGAALSAKEREFHKAARQLYEERLSAGVAREQARKDLPLSTYTEAYWKIDLHNLFHFLELRMDSHAQAEIRAYAEVIGHKILAAWCPSAWEAFLDYRTTGLHLTRLEAEIVQLVATGQKHLAVQRLQSEGLLNTDVSGLKRNRERDELVEKLQRLGLSCPWDAA